MGEEISNKQARRIALGAQGFGEGRPAGRIDRRHLRKVMGRLHLLQLDAVPVVIRTQYLPLFSRLGPYRTDLLDDVAYRRDEWFEAWSHEACLVPIEMEPWLRWSKDRARQGFTWRHLHETAHKDPGYIESVLAQVKARGPLAASELEDVRPRSGQWWGRRSGGTVALDWLFRIGAIGVRRDRAFAKRFDLLERIVPERVRSQPTPSLETALDELLLRAAKAHGIATADCLVDYFRLPVRIAKARLDGLVEDGKLICTRVEGWKKTAFRHPEVRSPRQIEVAALLSPFDPVVWNRKRIEFLFDFDYRIEIYTPQAKRVFGYYVLPFLLGDQLVARFDLKTDRVNSMLRVLGAYVEPKKDARHVAHAAARELLNLARLVGVQRIEVGQKGNLEGALRGELRALGSNG